MAHVEGQCTAIFNRGRRNFLRGAGAVICGGAFAGLAQRAFAIAPPKETGLSFEGLLKGKPGFQPRRPSPPPVAEIPAFLSKRQLEKNYEVYRQAFSNLLAAGEALATISRDPSHADKYKELRKEQMAAGNSALLHEFYFRNLATVRVRPSRYLRDNMTEHMGGLESWRDDFIACARVADSWAVLSYDPYDDRWHNAPLDRNDAGGWVGGNPLVVCDVAEDAWSIDYKDRETYITRFCEHIDWAAVASRYRKVDRH